MKVLITGGGGSTISRITNTGCTSNIRKCAIAIITIENISSVVRNINIQITIVI